MTDKDGESDEIIKKLVELGDNILREARQDYFTRDSKLIERLLDEQCSLERRLKGFDEG